MVEQYDEHRIADQDHRPVVGMDFDNCEQCGLAIVIHPYTGKWIHGLPD